MTTQYKLCVVLIGLSLISLKAVAEDTIVVKPVKVISAGEDTTYQSPNSYSQGDKPVVTESYPDGALMNAFQEEIYEVKKAEDLEKKAAKTRDDYEKKKVEAEREIAAKKYRIEGFKLKQEQTLTEMDSMKTELEDLDKQYKQTEGELVDVEHRAQNHFANADRTKKELEDSHTKLETSLDKLKFTKEQTAKNINKNQIQVQRMRSEIAVLEAEIESVEARKASLEADELKTRTEWMALKNMIEEKNADKEKFIATLSDTKKKLDLAQKDFKVAKTEFDDAEKERAMTENKVMAEVKKLDDSIAAAQRARAMSDAEKIRVEAETEKLKAYVAMVKKSNTQAIEAMKDAQDNVMESRLALETAKSELTREVATGESTGFKKEKMASRLRGLASVAESSDMLDGAKPWTVSKTCPIMKRPTDKADKVGKLEVGKRLIASEASGPWIKIMNASGKPAFVAKDCGSFDE